jgi:hypothetical protein
MNSTKGGKASTRKQAKVNFLKSDGQLAESVFDMHTPKKELGQDMAHRFVAQQLIAGFVDQDDGDNTCESHAGELLICYERERDGVFGCNKCVFENKMENPVFCSFQAKKTKQRLDAKYKEFSQRLNEVHALEPNQISQKIQRQLSTFFETQHLLLHEIEKQVFAQVLSSDSLTNLKQVIEQLHTRLNNPEVDGLTNAKKILEDKIQK